MIFFILIRKRKAMFYILEFGLHFWAGWPAILGMSQKCWKMLENAENIENFEKCWKCGKCWKISDLLPRTSKRNDRTAPMDQSSRFHFPRLSIHIIATLYGNQDSHIIKKCWKMLKTVEECWKMLKIQWFLKAKGFLMVDVLCIKIGRSFLLRLRRCFEIAKPRMSAPEELN